MKIKYLMAGLSAVGLTVAAAIAPLTAAASPSSLTYYPVQMKMFNQVVENGGGVDFLIRATVSANACKYQWYESVGGGQTSPISGQTSKTGTLPVYFADPRYPDQQTYVSNYVYVYNCAGKKIGYGVTPKYNARTIDDIFYFTFSGTWVHKSLSGAVGDTTSVTKQAGATATLSACYYNLGLVFDNGPGSGVVDVSIDGAPAQRVNLYSSTAKYRYLAYKTGGGGTCHTVTITNVSGQMNLDAAVVLGT